MKLKHKTKLKAGMQNKNPMRFIAYSGVLALTILGIMFMHSMWTSFYENKGGKWTVPEKHVEASGELEKTADGGQPVSVGDRIRGFVAKLKKEPPAQTAGNAQIASVGNKRTERDVFVKEGDVAKTYLQRGSDYIMKGDLDAGVKNLEAAVKLDPHYYPILNNARMLQRRMHRMGKDHLSADELRRVGAAMRPVEAERNVDTMGIPMTAQEREALRAKARAEYKGELPR